MHLGSVFILLVVAVVAESCDSETHYIKDGKCCKMCEPGKMMKETVNCEDPLCLDCADGEYQENYTKESLCKRQPRCDSNLNLQTPVRSKTQRSLCVCKPNHHCSSQSCDSCVKNRVCKAGERVSKPASENNDVECTPCPNGTFSEAESAAICKPWTLCDSGFKEVVPGTSTSDRECGTYIFIPCALSGLSRPRSAYRVHVLQCKSGVQ
ncbi:CD40 molecule, TNF receptor superfamily member 5 precursor [Silurus meridionalis]|nr:CD40 molecule, TNF receptor superfamily member 5 precursor [Silurus meridionalis]